MAALNGAFSSKPRNWLPEGSCKDQLWIEHEEFFFKILLPRKRPAKEHRNHMNKYMSSVLAVLCFKGFVTLVASSKQACILLNVHPTYQVGKNHVEPRCRRYLQIPRYLERVSVFQTFNPLYWLMNRDAMGLPGRWQSLTGWWCNNHLEKYEFVNGKDFPIYYGK